MRAGHLVLVAATAAASACSVPDKQPLDVDASTRPDAFIDDAAPDTMLTEAPGEFSREAAATFAFTSDEDPVTFECSVDGETPVPCTSPYTRTLGDGSHSFMVRATDPAGNQDETPAEHVWTIDRDAPDTDLTEHPPAADNSSMVRFSFTSDEDNVAFDCSVDGDAFQPCTSGTKFGPFGDGAHSFAVRAVDRAGNIDASPAVFAWSVDTSTPDTQLLTGPTGSTEATTATFTFVSPDAGAGATFTCALDGGGFSACTSPKTVSGLDEGNHTFAVRVRDAVGNVDPTPATRTWTVDSTAPNTIIESGPSGLVAAASATFTFSANEDNVTFQCSDDGGAYVGCTSPHNLTGLAQGPHTFAVRATDAANHTDQTAATRTWTVDTIAPDVTITAGPAPDSTVGPRVTFEFTVSEGSPTCSLDGAAFVACSSPAVYTLPAGPHELRVRATDGAGNAATVPRAFTVACSAPDTAGAAGLLHLDDGGQTQANAVLGGAPAFLGNDVTSEPADPDPLGAGRFGGALAFTASEDDHVTWPVALGPTTELTLELWARSSVQTGARDLAVSADGRIALRVASASPTTVRFSLTAVQEDGQVRTTTSAPVEGNAWHHVLGSIRPAMLRLWVDGERTSLAMTLGAAPALDTIVLGGSGGSGFTGAIDEVWLAQTAVTTDDVVLARYCPL